MAKSSNLRLGRMPALWYFADQEGPVGPLSLHELKDKIVNLSNAENVLVWADHLPDWKRTRDIPELVKLPAPGEPPPIETSEAIKPKTDAAAGRAKLAPKDWTSRQNTTETPPPAVWYYVDGGRETGPVSLQELNAKLATLSDPEKVLVWSNHLPHWKKSADVLELDIQPASLADPPTQISETIKPQKVAPGGAPQQPPPIHAQAPPVPTKDDPLEHNGMLRRRWFAKVETREDALKTINETSIAFFAVAAIQAVLGVLFYGPEVFIDVTLYVGFAAWLRHGKSLIAAVGLLAQASISMVMTIAAQLKLIKGGGNIFLATIVLYAAAKAAEATFKLHGRFKSDIRPNTSERLEGILTIPSQNPSGFIIPMLRQGLNKLSVRPLVVDSLPLIALALLVAAMIAVVLVGAFNGRGPAQQPAAMERPLPTNISSGADAYGNHFVSLDGPIVPGDAALLAAEILEANTRGYRLDALRLNSPGGDVWETLAMAVMVRWVENMATVIKKDAKCKSACFGLFAAGQRKIVDPISDPTQIGVHSIYVLIKQQGKTSTLFWKEREDTTVWAVRNSRRLAYRNQSLGRLLRRRPII